MAIKTFALATALLGSVLATSAHANLVTNGTFSASAYSTNTEFGTAYSQANQQGVTGWTGNNGYNIWFSSAAASTSVNTTGQYSSSGSEYLWAAANSPGGGAFVGLDGDQTSGVQGMISQSISGLVIGQTYQLDFDWAGAQVHSRTGATTDQLKATFGGQSFSTAVVNDPSQGFTGWIHQTFLFTATAATQTLSFLSIGTPAGLPPMALLDDVSLNAVSTVPEPMSLGLVGVGLSGIGLIRRRKAA